MQFQFSSLLILAAALVAIATPLDTNSVLETRALPPVARNCATCVGRSVRAPSMSLGSIFGLSTTYTIYVGVPFSAARNDKLQQIFPQPAHATPVLPGGNFSPRVIVWSQSVNGEVNNVTYISIMGTNGIKFPNINQKLQSLYPGIKFNCPAL